MTVTNRKHSAKRADSGELSGLSSFFGYVKEIQRVSSGLSKNDEILDIINRTQSVLSIGVARTCTFTRRVYVQHRSGLRRNSYEPTTSEKTLGFEWNFRAVFLLFFFYFERSEKRRLEKWKHVVVKPTCTLNLIFRFRHRLCNRPKRKRQYDCIRNQIITCFHFQWL